MFGQKVDSHHITLSLRMTVAQDSSENCQACLKFTFLLWKMNISLLISANLMNLILDLTSESTCSSCCWTGSGFSTLMRVGVICAGSSVDSFFIFLTRLETYKIKSYESLTVWQLNKIKSHVPLARDTQTVSKYAAYFLYSESEGSCYSYNGTR